MSMLSYITIYSGMLFYTQFADPKKNQHVWDRNIAKITEKYHYSAYSYVI